MGGGALQLPAAVLRASGSGAADAELRARVVLWRTNPHFASAAAIRSREAPALS